MSRVYWSDRFDVAELRGSERAHCDVTVRNMTLGLYDLEDYGRKGGYDRPPRIVKLMKDGYPYGYSWSERRDWFKRDFDLWRNGFSGGVWLMPDGTEQDAWTVDLNTAMRIGNDQVVLMARLHAQCEIHAWFEGDMREWIAEVIQGGRDTGLFRKDQGWEEVQEFLRQRDNEPVVLSYSVCDGFPNYELIRDWHLDGAPEDEDIDAEEISSDKWYENTTEDERWEQGMAALRKREPEFATQWTRDHWRYHFGYNISAFEINETASTL